MTKYLTACFAALYVFVLFAYFARAGQYDDWKAPPPVAQAQHVAPPLKRPPTPTQMLVNGIVEKENLPYIMIEGYDLKIAINPSVLQAYGLKSGDKVSAELMYKIIDADREFQRQLLK